MYYLQSRYYDPAICRFISADHYISTGQGILGYNMYAYCNNNPVVYVDETGEFPIFATIVIIAAAVVGGIIGAVVANNVEKERQEAYSNTLEQDTAIQNDSKCTMSAWEKTKYITAGILMGMAAGGAIVSLSGVVGSFIVENPHIAIGFFSNMTGFQTAALGALTMNISFAVIGPFANIKTELVEIPNNQFSFNNQYIP